MYGDESFYIQAATDGDGELTYKVKDESVVTVSADGKVTIKGTGTTDVVITAARTDVYEWASKTIHISVRGVVKKKSQTITVADIISIYEGNTVALDAATDGDGTISYVSDDKTVASVDASGKVCGIKQGTAHITVLASETELYHASETIVTVTVKPKRHRVIQIRGKNHRITCRRMIHRQQRIKNLLMAAAIHPGQQMVSRQRRNRP